MAVQDTRPATQKHDPSFMNNDLQALLQQDFGTLPDLIALHARQQPTHPAMIMDGQQLSYAQVQAGMERVAATLQRDGLQPGDAVAICAATSTNYLLAFLGALRAGVAIALLAPSASAENLDAMLDNAGAPVLLRDADVAARWPLQGPFGNHGVRCIAVDDTASVGQPWSDWLAAPGAVATPVDAAPDWPFNIIYSSGTTGVPKGIVQSCAMRWAHISRAYKNGYGPDTVSLVATPLYSNTTLVAVLPTLALGGTLVLMKKFDAGDYLALAEQHRATHTILVPVQYQRLMRYADFDRADLSSLQNKFCTSSPFSAALKAEVLRRWPGRLVEYYGLTEGGVRCELHCHEFPDKLHTVGRPGPGAKLYFLGEDDKPLPPGVDGEIVGHSRGMMTGYRKLPEKTRAAEWFDNDGTRFIRSGDVGHMDEDGFVVLGDRKKDMIISGGFNIYPTDIENVLVQHPGVEECAVVGVPSDKWGETPVAFVVGTAGQGCDCDQVREWLNARVGKTQRVAAVVPSDGLPRSGIGKVLKRQLREQFEALSVTVP